MNNMSWSKHIDLTCSKALKKLSYLRHTLRIALRETELLKYKTLISPIIQYGSIIWNPYKQSDIKKLESL